MGERERDTTGLTMVLAAFAALAVLSAATVRSVPASGPVSTSALDAPSGAQTEARSGARSASDDAPPSLARRASADASTEASDAGGSAPPVSSPAQAAADPPEPAAEPERSRLVLHGVGDTNFDPGYIPNLATYGYGYAFEGLGGLFERDDLTVVNLECAPSELGQRVPKTFNFRCDPVSLPIARANGVDVANLANNHVLDYGVEAMLDGRDNVEAAGIGAVGVGIDAAQAAEPALFEIGGWTVAVLGMGGVVPADWWLATSDRPGMASGDDIDQMVAAVEAAAAVADLVVVSIHWGRELVTEPDAGDRARAEAMVAAGADVVFGHHAHRLGALERVDGRPVFWTLGNFVWPRLSDAGSTTAVARVVVEPGGEIHACLIPAFITTSGRPELTGPPPCGPGAPAPPAAAQNSVS